METIGVWLRQAREARRATLEEVEAATRIRPRFLEALEAGDFTPFAGGEVQIRGFLRIYARYLGLASDAAMARYDAEVHGAAPLLSKLEGAATVALSATPAPQPAHPDHPVPSATAYQPASIPVITSRPRRTNAERLMIIGLAIIALLTVVAGVGYLMSRSDNGSAGAVTTSAATVPMETRLPSTTAFTRTSPLVTPTFPASPQGDVTLTLEATEHVWARVTVDGRMVSEGMIATGQDGTWSGQQTIVVETGNGAGLQVTVNNQPQGTMCGRAQVCTRAWGSSGEIPAP
jgi:transcriptional regulator with XRE-family HTH domain